MTDKQDPIAHAARLLREAAEELRQAHAYNNSEGWENETDAKAAYDEHLAAAQALEDWEQAIGAGGVQALSAGPMVTSEQRRLIGVIAEKIEDGTLFQSGIYQKKDLARFVRNMLDTTPTAPAASPTPPAEQQARPGAVYAELYEPDATTYGLGAVWNRHSMRDFADRTHALRIEKLESSYRAELDKLSRRNYELRMQAAPKAAPVTQQAGYAEVIECGNSYAKVKLKGEAFGSVRVGDIFYTALQQDEPVGEVVSASCDHATVRWLHQTSSVGGGDPRNSRAWPKVSGVSRDEGHSRALLVFFAAEPTDDEVRAVHDTLAAAPTAQAAPQPAPATQQAGDVVAYLDVGAGGYLDLGSELSEDALQQLPKGRHALVIAGTYGIDGYVAAPQPSPTTKPAPQQEAQEPVAWQGVHDQTDLYYTKPVQADVRPLYTAPQPAPAPLIARSLAEWHEQDGNVAWWAWNGREWAGEPAWIGTPNCEEWPGYHTHWTPHPEQP